MIKLSAGMYSLEDGTEEEREHLDSRYIKIGENSWTEIKGVRIMQDVYILPRPNTEIEQLMDTYLTRIPGELRWVRDAPKVEGKSIMQKATGLIMAVASGGVSEEEYDRRLNICKACPGMVSKGDQMWCNLCGCGRSSLAELHTKLRMRKVSCPLQRF